MSDLEPILDYIALGVPHGATVEQADLDGLARRSIVSQYGRRPPRVILLDPVDWLVTDNPAEAARHQPDHDCAACRAGHDQAVAYLAEHPGATLALGNLRYREVW